MILTSSRRPKFLFGCFVHINRHRNNQKALTNIIQLFGVIAVLTIATSHAKPARDMTLFTDPDPSNIGCLVTNKVCDSFQEFCYDDEAFGRCLPAYSMDVERYRYHLSKAEKKELKQQMEYLLSLGYDWSHLYMQCILQTWLETIKNREEWSPDVCKNLEDSDLSGALAALRSKSLDDTPMDQAFIEFSPSEKDPSTRYADEHYAPSMSNDRKYSDEQMWSDSIQPSYLSVLPSSERILSRLLKKEELMEKLRTKGARHRYQLDDEAEEVPKLYMKKGEPDINFLNIDEHSQNERELLDPQAVYTDLQAVPLDELYGLLNSIKSTSYQKQQDGLESERFLEDPVELSRPFQLHHFSGLYNSPDTFRRGIEVKDIIGEGEKEELPREPKEKVISLPVMDEEFPLAGSQDDDYVFGKRIENGDADDLLFIPQVDPEGSTLGAHKPRDPSTFYAPPVSDMLEFQGRDLSPLQNQNQQGVGIVMEGGPLTVSPEELQRPGSPFSNNWSALLDKLDFNVPLKHSGNLHKRNSSSGSFERRERLDVKKPGPWYNTKQQKTYSPGDSEEMSRKYTKSESTQLVNNINKAQPDFLVKQLNHKPSQYFDNSSNKEKKAADQSMNYKTFDVFSSPRFQPGSGMKAKFYVILTTDQSLSEEKATKAMERIADLLNMKRASFSNVKVDGSALSFRVEPNERGWSGIDIIHELEPLREGLKELGIRVKGAETGIVASNVSEPEKLSIVDGESDNPSNQILLATFAVCGLVAAALIATVVLFFVRKHSKSKEKMARIASDDPYSGACKEYQELCRSRMAGAKNVEKVDPLRKTANRNASKDSESSRSSTSSWSEEPAVSNLDISTGHMVLNYMEDHIKNRDRMEKEWSSLCSYKADSCSTSIAEKGENKKKNRFTNSLPYDHSRVVLNELANANSSDYINASTITDHDPRNPAYIATQGPLPNTTADFWQMVWEQGSVVIVNLTKCNDNGSSLCHRYWPEEGSELHHINEVHLVSEHIWCDEYLVRSFYLKNLKTGETRTVTQFHFLAWPENSIPQSIKALLEFRRKVNKSYRGRSCPIIVHCSDGAGRTGTYCLIDMVLNRMMKGAKEIDIAASLEHIRDQRPGMVRTKQQFEFVLMAVAEEVHAILKALPQ